MSNQRVTAKLRRIVVERAEECCEYCRSPAAFSRQSFSVEHIIPRSRGGENGLENLALSCQGCNNHKYNKIEGLDPLSRQVVPLYNPRQQDWGEHFAWNDDCTLMLGLTPMGRATIEELKLNQKRLVNLRRVLYAMKEHPPKVR
jgi:hypothetical protein